MTKPKHTLRWNMDKGEYEELFSFTPPFPVIAKPVELPYRLVPLPIPPQDKTEWWVPCMAGAICIGVLIWTLIEVY